MQPYATTDMMASIIGFGALFRNMLRTQCGLGVSEYRLLVFLDDQPEPVRPSEATRVLGTSPAMATVAANGLVEKGLVKRLEAANGAALTTTARGAKTAQRADLVLEDLHTALFSLLSAEHRRTIVTGMQMTVMATTKTNRMRNGSYYGEYETFHAFLILEKFMTETSHAHGLSLNGFRILFRLREQDGMSTPGQLAAALVLAPSAVTYALKPLEDDGLVTRTANRLDKRHVDIRITDSGAGILERTLQDLDPFLATGFRDAPAVERRSIQEAASLIAAELRKRI